MASEVQGTFINYYEHLNVPQDAPISVLQEAFDTFVATNQVRLNNPLTKDNALYAHNIIEPGIRQHLLSGTEARAAYDQQLRRVQNREARRAELADDEGLDDALRQPFFFDPIDGYDTETPAFSLRQIAYKLDTEWARAHTWITDTSDETHVFIGFLTDIARRPHLAERIEQIVDAVRRGRKNVNEGIERCINILDPHIERPTVSVHSPGFDGTVFDAGSFVADLPAKTELILGHEGIRGCVFGTLESRTEWVRFPSGQPTMQFTLMPEGTDPILGVTEIKLPLLLQVHTLAHNADHTARLLIHVENHEPAIEVPITMHVNIQPTPPRVVFSPIAAQQYPLQMETVRRGKIVIATITASNRGDEQLYPLTARIATRDSGASATPNRFHAGEPITLTVDTSSREFGKTYEVKFSIDYSLSPGAQGPQTLYVRGDILPTPWQSMLRERGIENRSLISILAGVVGYTLFSGGAWLATNAGLWWLFLLILPALFAIALLLIKTTTVAHRQRAGNTQAHLANVRPLLLRLWGIPTVLTIILLSIFAFTSNTSAIDAFSGIVGALIGLLVGFILDTAQPLRLDSSKASSKQHV